MKKVFILLTFCTSVLCLHAETYTGSCGDNLVWALNSESGTLSIMGSGSMTDTWTNSKKASIPWYSYRSYIRNIEISEGVATIGNFAFAECSNLNSISLPLSLTKIGEYAFMECYSLPSFIIPDSVTTVGRRAFENCENLTAVTFGLKVDTLGKPLFENCSNLHNIVWKARNCHKGFTAVNLLGSQISSFIIGEQVEVIPDNLLENMSNVKTITIPSSVTSIGSEAFKNCYNLTTVYCTGYIPASLGTSVFPSNTYGTEMRIYVPCNSLETYQSVWADYASKIKYDETANYSFVLTLNVNDVNMGTCKRPTTICDDTIITATPNEGYHFVQWSDGNTDNPRTITLTQDTTFTAEFAIDRSGKCGDDLALTWEYEPASKTLTISGEGALNSNYTYGLEAPDEAEKLVIEEGVTSIDHGAFYYCGTGCSWSQLKSVSIPTSVTYIAGKAINGVNEIHYTGTIEQWCTKSWKPTSIFRDYSLFMADTLLTDLVIPGSIKTIRNCAFEGCNSLHSVIISEGIDSIIQIPFYDCRNLVYVVMPHSIKSIGGKDFCGCDKLEAIYVPCGELPRIKRIFSGCHSDKLQYEPLPYSITVNAGENGGAYAARHDSICENYVLTATPVANYHFVQWNDGNTDNPRTVTLTQDTAFTAEFAIDRSGKCGDKLALDWSYDANSKALTISGNGSLNSNYTFGIEAPTEAVKLIISEGVTSIGNNAFSNYSTLQEISFPTTISTIGEQAFYQCTGLKHIYNYRERPCVAYSNTFDGIDKFECTLHVLSASVDMYRVATGWRDFYYIQTIDAETVTDPITSVVITPTENTANIIWPVIEGAFSYEITITKDDQTVCTLTFNAQGQLIGIAFAPAREMTKQQQAEGFRFTITGLTNNTQYGYSIVAKDANNNTLDTKSGSFTTTGEIPTAIEDVQVNSVQCTKILRDGQIFILRGNKTYTLQGQEVK